MLASPEDVIGVIRSALARHSSTRAPREVVNRYADLITSDPLLHIRIRELREKAFATPRRGGAPSRRRRRQVDSDDENQEDQDQDQDA